MFAVKTISRIRQQGQRLERAYFRRVCSRFDTDARRYLAFVHVASTVIWLKETRPRNLTGTNRLGVDLALAVAGLPEPGNQHVQRAPGNNFRSYAVKGLSVKT